MFQHFSIVCFLLWLGFSFGIDSNDLAEPNVTTTTEAPTRPFKILGLKLHNELRQKHGVEPLKLNETLSGAAQAYAHYLVLTNTFRNQLDPGYVKNLYQYRGSVSIDPLVAMEHAVDKWYGSMEKYNWTHPDVTPFSAMVWKATTDVGFGLRQRGKRTVIVAAYSPPGNVLGDDGDHFKTNVGRSLF